MVPFCCASYFWVTVVCVRAHVCVCVCVRAITIPDVSEFHTVSFTLKMETLIISETSAIQLTFTLYHNPEMGFTYKVAFVVCEPSASLCSK
jgi:hypothetical protein